MDDPLPVGRLDPAGNRLTDAQALRGREVGVLKKLAEGSSFDKFHDQHGDARFLLQGIDRGDVRVVQAGQKPGLPLQPLR